MPQVTPQAVPTLQTSPRTFRCRDWCAAHTAMATPLTAPVDFLSKQKKLASHESFLPSTSWNEEQNWKKRLVTSPMTGT